MDGALWRRRGQREQRIGGHPPRKDDDTDTDTTAKIHVTSRTERQGWHHATSTASQGSPCSSGPSGSPSRLCFAPLVLKSGRLHASRAAAPTSMRLHLLP